MLKLINWRRLGAIMTVLVVGGGAVILMANTYHTPKTTAVAAATRQYAGFSAHGVLTPLAAAIEVKLRANQQRIKSLSQQLQVERQRNGDLLAKNANLLQRNQTLGDANEVAAATLKSDALTIGAYQAQVGEANAQAAQANAEGFRIGLGLAGVPLLALLMYLARRRWRRCSRLAVKRQKSKLAMVDYGPAA